MYYWAFRNATTKVTGPVKTCKKFHFLKRWVSFCHKLQTFSIIHLGIGRCNSFSEFKSTFWHCSISVFLGYPRYCTATTLPDGTTVLNGGRSRRGKPRGPPGSRELQTALKGCDDPLFLDFIRRCLEWDPAARMTPNAALRHAWLRRRLPRPPQVTLFLSCNSP